MATISTHQGTEMDARHNRREASFVMGEKHIDASGVHETWCDYTSLEDVYRDMLGDACKEYNKGQVEKGHQERCKTPEMVLHEMQARWNKAKSNDDGKKTISRKVTPPVREMIAGVYPKDGENVSEDEMKQMLHEYVDRLSQEKNIRVIGAYYHADEQGSAPHVHIDFIPLSYSNKRGLSVQVSMSGALREMGFTDKDANGKTVRAEGLRKWNAYANGMLEEICKQHGVTVEHPQAGTDVKHLDTLEYKASKAKAKIEHNTQVLAKQKETWQTLSDDIASLKTEKTSLEGDIASLKAQKAKLEADKAEVDISLTEANKSLTEANKSITEAKEQGQKQIQREVDAFREKLGGVIDRSVYCPPKKGVMQQKPVPLRQKLEHLEEVHKRRIAGTAMPDNVRDIVQRGSKGKDGPQME